MIRRGVTLFEVMLSMLIMAIAVLSVALMLPAGLKAQEGGRFKAIAAVTAYNLINLAEHNRAVFFRMKIESNLPYGTPLITNEPGKWDMERILASSYWTRSAIIPMPPEIARRLDSADDEISKILDAGGQVYFPSPLPAGLGDFEGSTRKDGASISLVDEEIAYAFDGFEEAGRLVIGFIGHAQQNALPSHPLTAAPYREWYPSPPATHVRNHTTPEGDLSDMLLDDPIDPNDDDAESLMDFMNRGSIDLAMWKMWSDRDPTADWGDFQKMLRGFADYSVSPDPDSGAFFAGAHYELSRGRATDPDLTAPDLWDGDKGDFDNKYLREDVEKWYDLCLEFLNEQLSDDGDTAFNPASAATNIENTLTLHFGPNGHPNARQVNAIRYLAAAAMWRTRTDRIDSAAEPEFGWQDDGAGTVTYGPRADADAAQSMPLAAPVPDYAMYTAIHEHALRWAADYAEHYPYDWGAPRMYNRAVMMDNPLLQLDLFDGADNWSAAGDNVLNQADDPSRRAGYSPVYRIIAPKGCTLHQGGNQLVEASKLPTIWTDVAVRRNDIPTNYYGNWDTHENNYEIVYDRISSSWGRSEHFNLHSKFNAAERCRQMVIWAVDWQQYEDAETTPGVVSDASYYIYDARQTWRGFADNGSNYTMPYYRHRALGNLGMLGPLGQPLLWKAAPLDADGNLNWTGAEVEGGGGFFIKKLMRGAVTRGWRDADNLIGGGFMGTWLGQHGLDANGNGVIDRGTVPKSMRMRATVVARFNFYDQRTWQSVRN